MSNEKSSKAALPEKLWLTEAETATRLGMSQKWLQTQRLRGGGIRYARFSSAIRYAIADIEKFEKESLRSSTSDSVESDEGEQTASTKASRSKKRPSQPSSEGRE